VISVLLYGRNDAHGYNLHRRAAISLNCLAEVLTDPDDEIIFVDYNSPDELPTFVEALGDTLTPRCLHRLRVIRVPAAIHLERYAAHTDLAVAEPVARNVAARHSNASNRWLLSTNTDMILVPHSGRSLSSVCEELPDGFYSIPRYELPEWLWERLPRTDPTRALAEVARLGPGLRLDEPTLSYEWIRFDAPGDFQLVLRTDFFAIGGFDEDMLLGYHVDSNLSRRMLLHRGTIETLESGVSGYHCNHNRTPTVYHGTRPVNDPQRFLLALERAELPKQAETWGLVDVDVDEVPLRRRVALDVADTVMAVLAAASGDRLTSDATQAAFTLGYDSAHVLPFIADGLVFLPSSATVAYVGANALLEAMLSDLVERLDLDTPLAVPPLDDRDAVDDVLVSTDVVVVDLGLDVSLLEGRSDARTRKPAVSNVEPRLDLVFVALERFVELERERLARGSASRPIVLVNSSAFHWDPYIRANLNTSYTTPHSRVRRANVKPVVDESVVLDVDASQGRRVFRWTSRPSGPLVLRAGEAAVMTDPDRYEGFEQGWALPDEWGIWTEGARSSFRIGLEGSLDQVASLALLIGRTCVDPGESLAVDLLLDGEVVASRSFHEPEPDPVWRIELPDEVKLRRAALITLVVHEPRSPDAIGWFVDTRPLGVHLRAVALEPPKLNLWDVGPAGAAPGLLGSLRARIAPRRRLRRIARMLRLR